MNIDGSASGLGYAQRSLPSAYSGPTTGNHIAGQLTAAGD